MFLSQGETSAPHQIGLKKINSDDLSAAPVVSAPDRVVDLRGHIVGQALSPDNRQLYVNVRRWPDNAAMDFDEPPPIASEIEMRVIDLADLTCRDEMLTGHVGYTDSDSAFYIYLDVGDRLVASGSEDGVGRIWDRHYRCLVAKALHDKCVNSAVFNPRDQEMLVTGSDDHSIKIWRSRQNVRTMNVPKREGVTAGGGDGPAANTRSRQQDRKKEEPLL